MSDSACLWNEQRLGAGPLAFDIVSASHNGIELIALAGSTNAAVRVAANKIGVFFRLHPDVFFVCVDVVEVYAELSANIEARREFWELSRKGRLIDLRLLDRQVCCARDNPASKAREWTEILSSMAGQVFEPTTATTAADHERGDRTKLVMRVFSDLRRETDRIAATIGPLPPAPTEPLSLSVEARERMKASASSFLASLHTCVPPDSSDRSERTESGPSPPIVTNEEFPLGHRVEVWAALSMAVDCRLGFTVESIEGTPDLIERANENYRIACEELYQDQAARQAFEWEGKQVRRNSKGFPKDRRSQLVAWLSEASKRLGGAVNERADIPRDVGGRSTSNPEHWGCWASCDRTLWSWRQVFRMAEVARIGSNGSTCCPRFETSPILRSREPNLSVYRSLQIPVFRPRPGHVFLTGKIMNLPYHCLAEVVLKRNYIPNGLSRLRNFILKMDDPLAYIASELQAYRGSNGSSAISGNDDAWRRLSDALFKTLLLGLSDTLAVSFMRNEFQIFEISESEFVILKGIMTNDIVYELQAFMQDSTIEQAASALRLTANQEFGALHTHDNPTVAAQTMRNDLRDRRQRTPITALRGAAIAAGGAAPHLSRSALGNYRGESLGGRVTPTGTSATVRRHELRMSAEDVMISIAHELTSEGHSLLGIADDEFVLEVPAMEDCGNRLDSVIAAVKAASRRVLPETTPAIELREVDYW